MLLSRVRRIISGLWRPKFQVNEIDLAESLLDDVYFIDMEKLGELLEERDRLKKAKKRASHLDKDIELLRAAQLRREA